MNEIQIPHLVNADTIKITRVRDWSICFDYGSKHYLIHGASECGEGSWNELYERTLDKNGKWSLTSLKTCRGNEYLVKEYIKKQKGKTIVYSQIDKGFFAYKLTSHGLATGVYEKWVAANKNKIKKYQNKIQEYRDKIYEIERKIKELE